MGRPRLLMLDEPSLGLAPRVADRIFEVVQRISAEGTPVLLVEQNAAPVAPDRASRMRPRARRRRAGRSGRGASRRARTSAAPIWDSDPRARSRRATRPGAPDGQPAAPARRTKRLPTESGRPIMGSRICRSDRLRGREDRAWPRNGSRRSSTLRAAGARGPQGHRRSRRDRGPGARRAVRGRARAARRGPGPGEDPPGPHPGRLPRPLVLAHPVHAGPDAGGHHRHEHHRRGRRGAPALPVRAGARLREHPPGRRGQPRDARRRSPRSSRGCRSSSVDGGGDLAPSPGPLLRAGHAESDRDGGDVPAPGGAARPLPLQAARAVPRPRAAQRDHRPHHELARADRGARDDGGRDARRAGAGARGADRQPRPRVRVHARDGHPSRSGRTRRT